MDCQLMGNVGYGGIGENVMVGVVGVSVFDCEFALCVTLNVDVCFL